MFCPKCGKEISEQMKFCPKCGASVFKVPDNTAPTNSKSPVEHPPFSPIINTMAEKNKKSVVKNPVKYGCFALILVLLIGAVAARGSAQKSCGWAKSHFEDGTMYIYTVDELPGTVKDTSNKQSKTYMRLYKERYTSGLIPCTQAGFPTRT